ncbi:ABC transporter permease [Escherichia coli]
MIARWFWREWRSPSLLIVWLALSLAVACVLALGNISDRMEKGLSQQSREFMAGDRALRSSREVPQAWLEEAQKRGLKVGKQLTFATMTFAGDTPQLANVKAVDDIYPMYGDLQTNPPGLKPQAGSVLLAPRLMALLKPVLPAALPPASLWPWLWALGTMTVISLLVGLRPYRLLLATQPLRVLRNDVVANVWPLKFYLPIVSVVVVLLLAGLMGGSMLLWAVLAGAVVLALLCGVLGWMMLNVLRRMTLKSLPLRLAVSRLLRQPWSTLSQLSAFSLSFMLLALLLVLRGDLLDRWQQQLPPESPNYFLINIATEQVEPLKAFLAEHQIVPESFYPVVRARLTAINDKPTEGNEDEALNRELNLTWQNTRPDHNPIVAGNWPPKADEVSMEEGLAKRLNVALGDTVTFMGDTQEFRAKVTSLRKVDWESLRPNFYFIFPEGALDGQPQSWLTSFRWENGNGMLTQLNRQFPTISLLDIGAILKQVGQVLEQVSRALEVMVVLVTACGMLLLLAQVQVGMRQRHQELVVWRTLGAGKKLLRTTLWCEFAMLGFVSGLVAAIGAETALAVLQAKVFDFPWEPDWRLWIVLPCSGALLLSLFGGWLGARLVKGKALFRQFAG